MDNEINVEAPTLSLTIDGHAMEINVRFDPETREVQLDFSPVIQALVEAEPDLKDYPPWVKLRYPESLCDLEPALAGAVIFFFEDMERWFLVRQERARKGLVFVKNILSELGKAYKGADAERQPGQNGDH